MVNCFSWQIRIQKVIGYLAVWEIWKKTFYHLAEIDVKSLSLDIFWKQRTEMSFRDVLSLLFFWGGLDYETVSEASALQFCDFPVTLSAVPGRNYLISVYSFTRMSISWPFRFPLGADKYSFPLNWKVLLSPSKITSEWREKTKKP